MSKKIIFITGVTSGVGRETARRCSESGREDHQDMRYDDRRGVHPVPP